MNVFLLSNLALWMTLGGASDWAPPTDPMRMGPPPPGYERVVGEPMPRWSPAEFFRGPSAMDWEVLGPRPIVDEFWSGTDLASGRVVSIAPHPTDPMTVYIASASGGIWKTVDGGDAWFPLTDELATLNHGCIALDPQNPEIVYAGTGEYTMQSNGDGLFQSTDGGATWDRIGTVAEVGSTCSKVVVDPTDSDSIHVTGAAGYARTTDGGASWSTVLAGRASDLAVDPTGSIVWVAQHSAGIFKSTNGGASFSASTSGLPSSGFSRIILSMAPSNPSTLYTAFVTGGSVLGTYRTTNSGTTWNLLGQTPNFASPQAWYDCFLAVDPADPDTVYAGGVFPTYAVAGVTKTTNAGASWTDVTCPTGCTNGTGNPHPDMHTIAFGPGGEMWLGNDGGVWMSPDGGGSWTNKNLTLALTQNYQIALHPSDPGQLLGGTQDNGTVARDLGTEEWPQVLAGDGGYLAYDFSNPTTRYYTYVFLSVYRDVGGVVTEISGSWSGGNFIAPLVMDPNDSSTLLGGTAQVWRTENADGAANWTSLSVSLGSSINAIAVAEGESNSIYAGTSGGQLWTTTNGTSWTDRSSGLPGGSLSDIFVDPSDSAIAYVSLFSTTGGRVYKTANRGMSWVDLTGALPSGVAARALEVDWRHDPPTLYVGSGAGVYWSEDDGTSWDKDGSDLPNVNIGDLILDPTTNVLYAGTFGRGVWRATVDGPITIFGDGFESGDTSSWSNTVD